jgi:hypothetical protein
MRKRKNNALTTCIDTNATKHNKTHGTLYLRNYQYKPLILKMKRPGTGGSCL